MLEGYYEFKFSADNWAISESLDPGWACTNGNAQYTNRTLEVDENVVICPQWNACVPTCSSIIISEINENTKNQGDKDDLYQTAVEIIKSEGKASTSFLQRKLQIGYNRAARIIDMMEAEGIVSKANHVGKRDVL